MNRKKFFRNLLGATAAVTIGKYLPVPKVVSDTIRQYPLTPAECLPGIGSQAFKVFFTKGWFHKNDLIQTSKEQYIIVEEHKDHLTCLNVHDLNKPNLEIYFTPEQATHACDEVALVCSAMPEEYESK